MRDFVFWLILLVRALYKWLLHLITGRCSLLRIVTSRKSGCSKLVSMENNIRSSKALAKLNFLSSTDAEEEANIAALIRIKRIKHEYREELAEQLRKLLAFSTRYGMLTSEAQSLQREAVDLGGSASHRELLMRLWRHLRPGQALDADEPVSTRWTELGFQGKNPQTDFRGAGLLGLVQLEALASLHARDCRDIIETPFEEGFPLALASINFSALVLDWLRDGTLRPALYGAWDQAGDWRDAPPAQLLDAYNRIFGRIFIMFQRHWQRERPGVMRFNVEKDKFKAVLSARLAEEAFVRKLI